MSSRISIRYHVFKFNRNTKRFLSKHPNNGASDAKQMNNYSETCPALSRSCKASILLARRLISSAAHSSEFTARWCVLRAGSTVPFSNHVLGRIFSKKNYDWIGYLWRLKWISWRYCKFKRIKKLIVQWSVYTGWDYCFVSQHLLEVWILHKCGKISLVQSK